MPRSKPDPQAMTEPRLSRWRKPPGMAADKPQLTLRRQIGRVQTIEVQCLGDARQSPVFSELRVSNAQSGGRYLAAKRLD